MGAAYLSQARVDRAVEILENVKVDVFRHLGPKHAAGCCYNLGMAYRRSGRHADALRQFAEVGDSYPMSVYARMAERAQNATMEEAGMVRFAPKKETDTDW
jgi:TolA-binding protein